MADLPDFIPASQVMKGEQSPLPDFIPASQVEKPKNYRFGPTIGGAADSALEFIGAKPGNQSFGQDLLGATSMFGNAMIPAFDEGLAAVLPGVGVEEVRSAQSNLEEGVPNWIQYPAQIAAAIKSPINKLASGFIGGAKTLLGGAGRGVLAAGLEGGAHGFGAGEGLEDRVGRGVMSASFSAPFGLLGGAASYKGARRQAAENLTEVGGNEIIDMASRPTIAEDPFYMNRTLAEQTQSPRIAQLEQTLFKGDNPLTNRYTTMKNSRQEDLVNYLDDAIPGGFPSKEAAGKTIRKGISKAARTTKSAALAPLKAIDPNQTYPIAKLRSTMKDLDGLYPAGGMPPQVKELIDKVDELKGENSANFAFLHGLRKRAGDSIKALDKGADRTVANVATTRISKAIDSIIKEAAPVSGELDEAALSFSQFKKSFSDYKTKFGKEGIGNILKEKTKRGDYKIPNSKVVQKLWDGTPEATRAILKADLNPEVIKDVRRGIADKLFGETITDEKIFQYSSFRKVMKNNMEGLSAKYGGRRLFEREHLDAIKKVGRELNLYSPSSKRSVAKLATMASEGQSVTSQAERLARDYAKAKTSRALPFIGNALEALGVSREKAINTILSQAMMDKGFAKKLVEEAGEPNINWASKMIPKLVATFSLITTAPMSTEETRVDPIPQYEFNVEDNDLGQKVETPEPPQTTNATKQGIGGYKDVKTFIDSQPPIRRAMIEVESGGNPNAVSKAGAQGLMQLMPANSRKLGIDPLDPVQNVEGGSRILQEELNRYKEDPFLALAAYNAGSPRVDAAIEKAGTNVWEEVAKYLPAETRAYPDKVFKAYRKYQ